jgi:hypothetical protein
MSASSHVWLLHVISIFMISGIGGFVRNTGMLQQTYKAYSWRQEFPPRDNGLPTELKNVFFIILSPGSFKLGGCS